MTVARAAAILTLLLAGRAGATEPLSESADSLDFERFHRSADQGRPLIDLGRGEPPPAGVNVFDRELDNPGGKGVVRSEDLATSDASRASRHADRRGPPPAAGETMNIRVRYTLTRSENTPFLAHTAIHALHSYIVDHCPRGWIKLAEWSLPVGEDQYLYYQFRCADP